MSVMHSQTFLDEVMHIAAMPDREQMLNRALDFIKRSFAIEQVSLILFENTSQRIQGIVGDYLIAAQPRQDVLAESIEEWVVRHQQAIYTKDLLKDVRLGEAARTFLSDRLSVQPIIIAPCGEYAVITAIGAGLTASMLPQFETVGRALAIALARHQNTDIQKSVSMDNDLAIYAFPVLTYGISDAQAQASRALYKVQSNGKSSSLAITGRQGIGKSAFADWLIKEAQRQGFRTACVVTTTHDVSYSVWRELLLRLYPELASIQAVEQNFQDFLHRLKPEWRIRAGLLFDVLLQGHRTVSTLESYTIEQRQAAVATMICDLILFQQDSTRLLIVIEDIQHLDEASAYVLGRLGNYLAVNNGYTVLAVTTTETPPENFENIVLVPLTLSGVQEVRQDLIANAPAEDFDEWLFEQTAGNPFHLRLLLGYLHQKGLIGSFRSISKQSIHDLTGSIIDSLDMTQQRLLFAAAIAGSSFQEEQITVLLPGVNVSDILPQFSAFIYRDGNRWYFVNRIVREILQAHIPENTRHLMHIQMAEYIERQAPTDSAHIAYHYRLSTSPDRAWSYLVRAANAAHARGALHEALNFINEILQLPGEIGEMERFAVYTEQADLFLALGDYAQTAEVLDRLSGIALRLDDSWLHADVSWRWLNYYHVTDQAAEGIATARVFIEHANQSFHTVARAEISLAMALIYEKLEDYAAAQEHLDQVVQIAGQTRKIALGARMLYMLGNIFQKTGRYDLAQACLEQAGELFLRENDQVGVANAESQLGKMYYEIGYLPAAGEHLQVSKRLWTMLGNPLEAAQDTFVLVETLRLGERFIEATDSIFEIQPVVLRLGSEKLAGDWWFQYAVICAVMSSFSQCIDSLNKALDYYPQNCPEQRAACYALMIYATAKIERKVDEQHALEALQVLDPDLTTFTYAPSICTGLASVLKDEPLRAALLQKSSRHLKAAAQKITDESIREQFFARPDRHTLLNLSKSEYMG